MQRDQHEWLFGWDATPGIVSVWADSSGRATVWRRVAGVLRREEDHFRPWLLLRHVSDLRHLGPRLARAGHESRQTVASVTELDGPGELRYLVRALDGAQLAQAVLQGASLRHRRPLRHLRELAPAEVLVLPPEEQYLVASGRNYFGDLTFHDLRRMAFDLETTGLDPEVDRIFLVAVRDPDGRTHTLEGEERSILQQLEQAVHRCDPDVIENHNLHGFDLPFVVRRAELLRLPLSLGRAGPPGFQRRPAMRGSAFSRHDDDPMRRARFSVPGRELIDTLDAVRRHDFSARDLPGHGLKAVARHMGLAGPDRELIPGAEIFATYATDPERVRRYAREDVHEAAGLAEVLGGAAFALARMAPRRYERLADAGAATGVLDPLLVRAYLRAGEALPVHQAGDGTEHHGAALHLFAAGVAHRVVKADVASLYPSLMLEYAIGPRRDRLGVMLGLVDRLLAERLAAKYRARQEAKGSRQRYVDEAISAAMKIVVNSAYGYLGAGALTRFSDVHAANEITRRGRELLSLICAQLAARGVTLLEADTDGVYFAVPEGWSEEQERQVVREVNDLLPERVSLEFDGRYAAMLSHEPKNYALLAHDGQLTLRGVAFRSSRSEPYGEAFLRSALRRLFAGDVAGVREVFVAAVLALRRRQVPTREVAARVRLSKTPDEYAATRGERRELAYEALLTAGQDDWEPGERLLVYRATGGRAGLLDEDAADDPRDYDVEHYVRQLRDTFAARLVRALTAEDFAAVVADPEQPSLFPADLSAARPILTVLG